MELTQTPEQERAMGLKENLTNETTARYFGLTETEITNLLDAIDFSQGGFLLCFCLPVLVTTIVIDPKY